VHQIRRVEEAREIVENVLGVIGTVDADDRQAGGLGSGTDQGEVLSDDGVEEGALADVGPAGEGDISASGVGGHGGKIGGWLLGVSGDWYFQM